ncbi:hypothetical protein ACSBR1_026131 [Camellia fascicularis]
MTPAVPVNHGKKLEKFNGNNFKRWQQKMMFYLTILNLARFTHEKAPALEGETDQQVVAAVDANMVIFCVETISSIGWTIHCTMCIVLKALLKNCRNLWIISIRQRMPV